jgi:hypothetical protein
MKKRIVLALVLVLTALLLVGCSAKKALTADEFKTKMEAEGFEVEDVTEQFGGAIEKCYVAMQKDGDFQFEFFVAAEEDQAKQAYSQNKSDFEATKTNGSVETNKELANYGRYTLVNDGNYSVISRIDKTFLFLDAQSSYKDDINKVLKTLGY